jgi:hypothetical protein
LRKTSAKQKCFYYGLKPIDRDYSQTHVYEKTKY